MAMTQPVLLFLAGMALLATIGMFAEWQDRGTTLVVSVVASILWGIVGINSFDVVKTTSGVTTHYEILPMVYVGFGFSAATGLFALAWLLKVLGRESGMTDEQGIGGLP